MKANYFEQKATTTVLRYITIEPATVYRNLPILTVKILAASTQ